MVFVVTIDSIILLSEHLCADKVRLYILANSVKNDF